MNLIKKRLNAIYSDCFTDKQLRAKKLIDGGYYQVSRKFRTLARLPKDMTGKQALLEIAKNERPWDAEEWVNNLGDGAAGDHYLRCYSPESDYLEVGESIFQAFRDVGGNTYKTIYWEKRNKENVGIICSGCRENKITVNRNMFDGLCADCTDKALFDDDFREKAQKRNEEFIEKEQ